MKKIKCIVKRPDEEYGHMTNVSNRLENLQRTVGGYIEIVPIINNLEDGASVVCICDEDGKNKGYDKNFRLYGDVLVGTVIICGAKGEDLTDIPINFQTWKKVLDRLQEFRL